MVNRLANLPAQILPHAADEICDEFIDARVTITRYVQIKLDELRETDAPGKGLS